MEEGVFPHSVALRDAARPRGGAPALLRRHDARDGAAHDHERRGAPALRLAQLRRAVALPRRDPARGRRADRRPRARPARAARARRGAPHYDYSYAQADPGEVAAGIARGMRVRHPHFGTGVVLSVTGSGAEPEAQDPVRARGREDARCSSSRISSWAEAGTSTTCAAVPRSARSVGPAGPSSAGTSSPAAGGRYRSRARSSCSWSRGPDAGSRFTVDGDAIRDRARGAPQQGRAGRDRPARPERLAAARDDPRERARDR